MYLLKFMLLAQLFNIIHMVDRADSDSGCLIGWRAECFTFPPDHTMNYVDFVAFVEFAFSKLRSALTNSHNY